MTSSQAHQNSVADRPPDTDAAEPSTEISTTDVSTVEDASDVPVASLVRPYALTAGRTTPEVHLPLEAPVHVVSPAVPSTWSSSDVRSKIVSLCASGPSVAEISAHLSLPLGVARVLVGDLVDNGTLRVSATLGDDASADERRELIGRTLRGLRAL